MDVKKDIRCVTCYKEFVLAELPTGTARCPECGDTGVPMAIEQDHTLNINWHELRMITIWASNYAATTLKKDIGARRALDAILSRLQNQRKAGWPALTLVGEFTELAENMAGKVGDIEIDQGDEKVIIKKNYVM